MKHLFLAVTFFAIATPLFAKFNYPPEMEGAETFSYKTVGKDSLDMHVFKPKDWKSTDFRPAVVFFFGGGWKAGSPEQFKMHCQHLAKRGIVAFAVDYRVSGRHGTKVTACLEDAQDAIRCVRKFSGDFGVDPGSIAAGGGSAGGHLAACLGTIDGEEEGRISPAPNALLLFNPACVMAPWKGKTPWEEDRSEEFRDRMGTEPINLSPIHHVTGDVPPTIIFHGTGDTQVPFSTSASFAEELKNKGIRCDLKAYEGEAHGFFNYGRNENIPFQKTLEEMDAFLVELKWLEKET